MGGIVLLTLNTDMISWTFGFVNNKAQRVSFYRN